MCWCSLFFYFDLCWFFEMLLHKTLLNVMLFLCVTQKFVWVLLKLFLHVLSHPPLSLSQLDWTVAVWEQHKYTTILTCNTIRTYNCHWLDADLDNWKSYNLIHIWIWDELFCSILDISPPKPKMMCQKFSLHLTRLILCYKYIIDWGITWQWLFWHFESEFKKQIQINWEYKSIFMLFDI